MDLVEVKQRQLLEQAQLPLSDLTFLMDTRLFDADDVELHMWSTPPLTYQLLSCID